MRNQPLKIVIGLSVYLICMPYVHAQMHSAAPTYSAQPTYSSKPASYSTQNGNNITINGMTGGQIAHTATHTIVNGATFYGQGSDLNRISAHSKGKVILNNVRIVSHNASASPIDISAKHIDIKNLYMISNGANIQHSNCSSLICLKKETANIDNVKVDVINNHKFQIKGY